MVSGGIRLKKMESRKRGKVKRKILSERSEKIYLQVQLVFSCTFQEFFLLFLQLMILSDKRISKKLLPKIKSWWHVMRMVNRKYVWNESKEHDEQCWVCFPFQWSLSSFILPHFQTLSDLLKWYKSDQLFAWWKDVSRLQVRLFSMKEAKVFNNF